MLLYLLLNESRLFGSLHTWHILLLCSLLDHFLVIIKLYLLNHYKIEPIDVVCHLTVFSIVFVLKFFDLIETFSLIHIHLTMLTCFATLIKSILSISICFKYLQILTFWSHNSTIRLNKSCEIAEESMRWLEEVEPGVSDLALSESL